MLSLALMALSKESSINAWHARLRRDEKMCEDMDLGRTPPSVATHYRLIQQIGVLFGGEELRASRVVRKDEAKAQARERDGRKVGSDKGVVREALERASAGALTHDLEGLARLLNRLLLAAVEESRGRWVMGGRWVSAVDGSQMPSWSKRARRVCACKEKCDCARLYFDPTAGNGYSRARDEYVFGSRVSAVVAKSLDRREELPLSVYVSKMRDGEATVAMGQLLSMSRASPGVLGESILGDMGYSGAPMCALAEQIGVTPTVRQKEKARDELVVLNDVSPPRCPSGQEMKRHGARGDQVIFVCGAHVGRERTFDRSRCQAAVPCEQGSKGKIGLTAYVSKGSALLERVRAAQETPEFKALYRHRTCVERFFSVIKSPSRVIRTRRVAVLQTLLVFQAVSMHVAAWLRFEHGFQGDLLEGVLLVARPM